MPFEVVLTTSVLLVALLVLLGRLPPRCWRPMGLVLTVAGCGGFALATSHWWPPGDAPSTPSERPIQRPTADYATSGTCRTCHPRNYATWHASWHRTMTQLITPARALGTFDGQAHEVRGHRYRTLVRDGSLWGEISPSDVGPRTSTGTEVPLVMSTGSHHMQVYWYPTGKGRALGQFPLVFLADEARWIPRNAAFLMPPDTDPDDETGRWNTTCMNCHSTHPRPRLINPHPLSTRAQVDSRVGEFGIACEACHGPASRHVSDNRNPLRRYARHLGSRPDPTPDSIVVNPARLSATAGSQVCGQCHSVTLPKDRATSLLMWENGPLYRPGNPLTAHRHVVSGRPETDRAVSEQLQGDYEAFVASKFWADGMVRVSGREYNGLIRSPCYTHGEVERGILSCFSCHRLHQGPDDQRPVSQWADDQLDTGMGSNRACTQCHGELEEDAALQRHTHHDAKSSGSNCYNCHMPYTTYGLLKAIRSHTIDNPSVRTTLSTGRPNACNICHLEESLGWTADWLQRWYGHDRPSMAVEHEAVPAVAVAALAGDAGQRALAAWSLGWKPALEASGQGWQARLLAVLMTDPYDAVRLIAHRSLRRHDGYESVEYDFLGDESARARAAARVMGIWHGHTTRGPRLSDTWYSKLLDSRDTRPVTLAE